MLVAENNEWDKSEHPINPDVRSEIKLILDQIEKDHDVRILYACESGSRGWGFSSPDSDYDVRFIYVNKLDWYLTVFPGGSSFDEVEEGERISKYDVIELPVNEVFDVNGWDIRKALGLLQKGNATLVEWLSSPVIYRAEAKFLLAMRAAATLIHRPERSFYHYIHMAKKNYREHVCGDIVKLKKYLYVLRPILACLWIEQQLGPVPMRFQELVDRLIMDSELNNAIQDLLKIKRARSEVGEGAAIPIINKFIETHLERLGNKKDFIYKEDHDFSILDILLRDTVLSQL